MAKTPTYDVLIHEDMFAAAGDYADRLRTDRATAGRRLHAVAPRPKDASTLIDALLQTKLPQVFAESTVAGDGSDWTREELNILGGISIAVNATVFDDGTHQEPNTHAETLEAGLVFVPGVLLRNDTGREPLDWDLIDGRTGTILVDRYLDRYRQKLIPAFAWIQSHAMLAGKVAVVTVPGIGAGQFAGTFRGTLGGHFERALEAILAPLADRLTAVRLIYFDPYNECTDQERTYAQVSLRTRPYSRGGHRRAQLCRPDQYSEEGDDFTHARLYSLVAWDPVSWPGNDFYAGVRATDDGVKAAATDVISRLTGLAGKYDPAAYGYRPAGNYRNWEDAVISEKLKLGVEGRLHVIGEDDVGTPVQPLNPRPF